MRRQFSSLLLRSVAFLVFPNISLGPAHAASIAQTPPQSAPGFGSWMSGASLSQTTLVTSSPDDWLGGTGSWSNYADWSAGEPSGGSNVFISTGSDNVSLDTSSYIATLTLGGFSGSSTLADLSGGDYTVSIAGALTINPSGTLSLQGFDQVVANADSMNAGTINLSAGGQVSVNGNFTNSGSVNFLNIGGVEVSGTLTNSGNMSALVAGSGIGAGNLVNSGNIAVTVLTVTGTITNLSGGIINATSMTVADMINQGAVYGFGRSGSQLDIAGTLTNSGRFDTTFSNDQAGALSNSGTVYVGGTLTVVGNTTNSGNILEAYIGPSNGQFFSIGGTLTNLETGSVDITGPYVGGRANEVINYGRIDVEDSGSFAAGNLTNTGRIMTGIQGGGSLLSISGTLTNRGGGILSLGGMGDVADIGYINNAGAISIANGATLNITGGSHASANAFPGFLNSGTVLVARGATVSSPLTYTQTSGQTTVDGTLHVGGHGNVNFVGGAVYGNGGDIQGNVISNAAFNVGDMPMTTGQMAITGNYTQGANGSLAFDIASLTQFDRLNISGHAQLDGTMYVDLLHGYIPQIGTMFDVMNFAGESGTFSMVVGLPINNQEHFVLEYNSTNLTLDVVSGPDQQAAPGKGSAYYEPYVSDIMAGTNQLDSSTPSSTVPEPGSLMLLASGSVGIVAARRRKRV